MRCPRPRRLIGVLGTDTGVGKTWTIIQLVQHMQVQGLRVSVRKPVQSFDPRDCTTDADLLAEASRESPYHVCKPQHWYTRPMAPPMAADVLERGPISIRNLLYDLDWPADADVGFIETVGGPRSPIAHDSDSVDLLHRCDIDEMLLVAGAGLGAINAVRLAASVCGGRRALTVYLNRYDIGNDLHRRNAEWLQRIDGLSVFADLRACAWKLARSS